MDATANRRHISEILFLTSFLVGVITTRGFCVSSNASNDTRSAPSQALGGVRINHAQTQGDAISAEPDEDKRIHVLQSLDNRISKLESNLEQIKEQIGQSLDYHIKCSEAAMSSVNTSIAGANYALGIFGIVITLVALGLGIYVGWQVKSVANLTRENRSMHEMHLQISDEVRKLDQMIKNSLSDLYNRLQHEESRALVNRLRGVPEDVVNLFTVLTSRQLSKELFDPFKEAYQSLSKDSSKHGRFGGQYLTLFFQHFAGQALFDGDIAPEVEKAYTMVMDNSFENDMKGSAREFFAVCVRDGILNHRGKIVTFFKALSRSHHKKCSELHKQIYDTLSTKENRFAAYSVLKSENDINVAELTRIYGQLLQNDYKDASGNTESEQLVLKEIADEITEKDKEQKDDRKESGCEGTTV